MQLLKAFLTIFLFSIITAQSIPKIDIFTESLCPDCMEFLQASLSAYQSNPSKTQLADIYIYTYGNAHESWNGSKWVFECQHGNNECYGNFIETCAKAKLNKDEYFNFLICLDGSLIKSESEDFNKAISDCLENEKVKLILECANSDEGDRLEHEVAQKTPEHDYVPWVVVDGRHDENVEQQIFENMIKYLCKEKSYLEGCKEQYMEIKPFILGGCSYIPLEFLKFFD
jgi:interferon gamma-inducible protein 30